MPENQKDLVLSPNEYAYILDETKGNVGCNVGPHKMSLSQSDRLVIFDNTLKRFVPCESYNKAIQLFTTAPEGWYIALKNPAPGDKHPQVGTSNPIPENMKIGYKVNIPGPVSFALYPGQMAQVIKGHTLRSNQYLVARVYDAESLNNSKEERGDEYEGDYINGQILIIKGTEISFYIPPTGIEVKAIDNNPKKGYVRDAVTLERLEYCMLKDEDGNKRYVHGPEVVFPSPTETFIEDGNGHIKRNAIELSDISGVYVKVISDYKENGKEYHTGDELFITGKDQMIYYPRPEHTFITYNGRVMHHAIAIPKGEGRYIMNRMTGDIKTVRGPAMYLPDPRTEVAVKRILSRSQCELWYPGNREVLEANGYGANANKSLADNGTAFLNSVVGTFYDATMEPSTVSCYTGTPTKKETNKISRSNTFTPPRTISLNSSKFEGAVGVDVWTGYAVNVISKDGTRKVVCGPQTILLDYDQTLETLELSTGKPKTTDRLEHIAFLRHENNRVSDIINVETSDFVKAEIKVSYLVNFDMDMQDKWFSVDNYVKHLCDWARAAVKRAVKKFSITDLCDNCSDILLAAITDADKDSGYLHKFEENGMFISDAEMLALRVDDEIQRLIDDHQETIVTKALQLNAAQASAETEKQIQALSADKERILQEYKRSIADERAKTDKRLFEIEVETNKAHDEEEQRVRQAELDLQALMDSIAEAKLERDKKASAAEIEYQTALDEVKAKAEDRAAENMKKVLEAISPDLSAALNAENNKEVVQAIAESIAPYAVANGDSVADAINTILRGTTLENVVKNMQKKD